MPKIDRPQLVEIVEAYRCRKRDEDIAMVASMKGNYVWC